MKAESNEFDPEERELRDGIQEELKQTLLALKRSMKERDYDQAVLLCLSASRYLRELDEHGLATDADRSLLYAMRSNVHEIFRIQNRYH